MILRVADLLRGAGEEGARAGRLVLGDVEEVGVVCPDPGRLGSEFLDNDLEELVGRLSTLAFRAYFEWG